MSTATHSDTIQVLENLPSTIRDEAARATDGEAVSLVAAALRAADALTQTAVALIGGRMPTGSFERTTGLSQELLLMLDARRTGAEARMLTHCAATLRAMPRTAEVFERGLLSFGQVRAIVGAVKYVDAAGRARVDDLIGREAPRQLQSDPDELISRVDDEVATLRADLALAREDRAIESNFLAVQPRLGGGGSFYGEADAESLSTIVDALDAAAPAPVDSEPEGAPTRAQQHFEGLLSICEASLSGASGGSTRPRPRLLATVDLDSLSTDGTGAARLLWALAGRPARLTLLSTETLSCDAQVIPVIFDGSRPIAVGDAQSPVGPKLRTALVARDQGCRFPGCRAPAVWTDAHHRTARLDGGGTEIENLVLLCRRHHRAVHRHRWRITTHDDGTMEFARRGRRYLSPPKRRQRE